MLSGGQPAQEARMQVSEPQVGRHTAMGATLVPGGATFRTWAPSARDGSANTSL